MNAILVSLRTKLMDEYLSYKEEVISEKEYLARAKPIDMAIGKLEMAILQDTPAWKEVFSQLSLTP